MNQTVTTNSPQQTIQFGEKIAKSLKGGEVIALTGPLGSGKTHFVKGIAVGLEADSSEPVNSPTFVLVNEYFGRLEMYHIDAYRIESSKEFEMLGFDELCHQKSVVLIEWADKFPQILENVDCIYARFKHIDPQSRQISITDSAMQGLRVPHIWSNPPGCQYPVCP
jgi:tRNA threonylcarbamoyladenosine biosynthesis protein TsaE